MNTQTQGTLERFIGHEVVDQQDKKIGKLTCLWADNNTQPAYLGVKTSWLLGKTHVVPADRVEVNGFSHTIRLPYSTQQVKDAPSFDPDAELDSNAQSQVRSHFNIGMGIGMESTASASASKEPQRTKGTPQEAANVQLQEEQMKVGKRQVEAGGIRLRKIIRTETVNQPVELQREEVVVERIPGGQPAQTGTASFRQQDVFIPLWREEPVVQKETRVREEVRVSKKIQAEPQTVSGQVRKEDLDVQRTGAPSASASARSYGQGGTRAVFGICQSEQQATKVIDQLKRTGFSDDDISVHMPDGGGIGSMLNGLGILEYDAKRLEGKCRPGTVVISVKSVTAEEISSVRDVFQSAGVSDISEAGGGSAMDKAA